MATIDGGGITNPIQDPDIDPSTGLPWGTVPPPPFSAVNDPPLPLGAPGTGVTSGSTFIPPLDSGAPVTPTVTGGSPGGFIAPVGGDIAPPPPPPAPVINDVPPSGSGVPYTGATAPTGPNPITATNQINAPTPITTLPATGTVPPPPGPQPIPPPSPPPGPEPIPAGPPGGGSGPGGPSLPPLPPPPPLPPSAIGFNPFVPPAPVASSGQEGPQDFGQGQRGRPSESFGAQPGNHEGFRPQAPNWARGLQRSPFAQFQGHSQPFAASPYGGGFAPDVSPDELLRRQQSQVPAWIVP